MQKNQELTTDGQDKNIKWNFQFSQDKLLIEAFTQITYKGEFVGFPGVDLNQFAKCIQKGEFTIKTKTTSELQILVGFITITLKSEAIIQTLQLKQRINKCEEENKVLKSTIDQLRIELSKQHQTINQFKIQLSKQHQTQIQMAKQNQNNLKSTINQLRVQLRKQYESVLKSTIDQLKFKLTKQNQTPQCQNNDNFKWSFNTSKSILQIEAYCKKTQIVYKGQLNCQKNINFQRIKDQITNGNYIHLIKTVSQFKIVVFYIQISLYSKAYIQNKQLKQKNTALQSTIDQLRANLHNLQWEDVNLDNKQQKFDLNYDYKIIMKNNDYTFFPVYITTSYLYHTNGGGSQYSTAYNNKKVSSIGWTVTQIQRRKK